MVKHVILWKLKEEYSIEEKETIKKNIKSALESLQGKIDGLEEIKVVIDTLETSTVDLMLDSTFESFEALKGYSVHPEHVHAADTFVRPFTAVRSCIDFEM